MGDTSEMVKEIRTFISQLMKQVDEFAVGVENQITEREKELDTEIKNVEKLKEREKLLNEKENKLKQWEAEISKQSQANRDFKIALDKREAELKIKTQRLQTIIND